MKLPRPQRGILPSTDKVLALAGWSKEAPGGLQCTWVKCAPPSLQYMRLALQSTLPTLIRALSLPSLQLVTPVWLRWCCGVGWAPSGWGAQRVSLTARERQPHSTARSLLDESRCVNLLHKICERPAYEAAPRAERWMAMRPRNTRQAPPHAVTSQDKNSTGTHRQSCRNTSCRSLCSTARRPYSGAGRLAMHSVATCWTMWGLSCGLIRPANATANWASLARTYSCGCSGRQPSLAETVGNIAHSTRTPLGYG